MASDSVLGAIKVYLSTTDVWDAIGGRYRLDVAEPNIVLPFLIVRNTGGTVEATSGSRFERVEAEFSVVAVKAEDAKAIALQLLGVLKENTPLVLNPPALTLVGIWVQQSVIVTETSGYGPAGSKVFAATLYYEFLASRTL